GKQAGVLNDGTAIYLGVMLNAAASSDHGAGTDASIRTYESRRQDPCSFFNLGARRSPDSGADLLAGGSGFCFQRENVNGELPQVNRVRERIEIAEAFELRAVTAAMGKPAAEQ